MIGILIALLRVRSGDGDDDEFGNGMAGFNCDEDFLFVFRLHLVVVTVRECDRCLMIVDEKCLRNWDWQL